MDKKQICNDLISFIKNEAVNTSKTDKIKQLLNDFSRIAIYGAGNIGRHCFNYIDKNSDIFNNVEIVCFFDKNADNIQQYEGYPVYKIEEAPFDEDEKQNILIIIALISDNYSSIEQKLEEQHYRYIKYFQYFNYLSYDDIGIGEQKYFLRDIEQITNALMLMEDDISNDVYTAAIKAHITKETCSMPIQNPKMIQYFDVNVPFKNKYQNFVDCGAFVGDTLEKCIKMHKPDTYFAFEPDNTNFTKLAQLAGDVNKTNNCKIILFPVGVSDKNEFVRFSAQENANSRIDDTGDVIIQTVRLDDILLGYDKLMIKMDVEGAEAAALHGTQNLIKRTAPDLAICVYHKISDLWRIPIMLKTWMPDYKFYLRNHDVCTLETVLYCTV